MLDKTFIHFFVGFVVIIGVAFAVLATAGTQIQDAEPQDQVANP